MRVLSPDEIVQMRKAGVSVKEISKLTERSTHCIYRLLKKANDAQQNMTTTEKKRASPSTEGQSEPLSDSSAPLLCAVESMDVSAFEPIPMPLDASVGFATAPVAARVAEPRGNEANAGLWFLRDATASTGFPPTSQAVADIENQVQSLPSKKQKTSTSQGPSHVTRCPPSLTPTSSQLAINQRSHTTGGTATSNYSSYDGFVELLKRIQDEIRRLEDLAQSDIYDAQLLQMLVKFHAELLLVQIQKAHCNVVEVSCERVTEEGSGDVDISRLLRRRLEKEITLLDVQADREKLELERERIKHKTTSILCRKRLLDAHASPAVVDKLLPRQ